MYSNLFARDLLRFLHDTQRGHDLEYLGSAKAACHFYRQMLLEQLQSLQDNIVIAMNVMLKFPKTSTTTKLNLHRKTNPYVVGKEKKLSVLTTIQQNC